MIKPMITENQLGSKSVIFTVETSQAGTVYMSINESSFYNDKRGVVFVDAARFLELWRSNPLKHHEEVYSGSPETWVNDRKYPNAAIAFSQSTSSPVLLASIAYEVAQNGNLIFEYLSICDGVTRTIWLLTNGASCFPVECKMPGAIKLHKLVGVPNSHLITVDQLLF